MNEKYLEMTPKDIEKLKNMPEVRMFVNNSKDEKWIILKRVETYIYPRKFWEKVLEPRPDGFEEEKEKGFYEMID